MQESGQCQLLRQTVQGDANQAFAALRRAVFLVWVRLKLARPSSKSNWLNAPKLEGEAT